jgi:hypothetical protein
VIPSKENFPYTNLSALRSVLDSRRAEVEVDPEVALQWALGSSSPESAKVAVRLLRLGPPLAVLFIAYYSFEFQPWMATTLPLFWLTLFLARHPSKLPPFMRRFAVRAFMRRSLTAILLLGVVAWIFDRNSMNVVRVAGLAQLFAGFAHFMKYDISVSALKQAALDNETLFTSLWNDNAIRVVSTDGKGYSRDQVEVLDPRHYPCLMADRLRKAAGHYED